MRDFDQGDFVLLIDDSNVCLDRTGLTSDQVIHLDLFIDQEGRERVVYMQSPEKYINHSCAPNLVIKTDMKTGRDGRTHWQESPKVMKSRGTMN